MIEWTNNTMILRGIWKKFVTLGKYNYVDVLSFATELHVARDTIDLVVEV